MAKKVEITDQTVFLYKSTLMNNSQVFREWNFQAYTKEQAMKYKLPIPPLNFQGVPTEKRHSNVRKNTFYVKAEKIPQIFLDSEGNPKKKFDKKPFQVLQYEAGEVTTPTQVVASSNDIELKKKEQEIENLKKQLEAQKKQMALKIEKQPESLSKDK